MNLHYRPLQGFVAACENYTHEERAEETCDWCGAEALVNSDRLCPACEKEYVQQNQCSRQGIVCTFNFCDCRKNNCPIFFFNRLQTM